MSPAPKVWTGSNSSGSSQVAQTITVHHGALAYLLGINALRASEAAAVRIEDYAETLRGHRALHLVGKGNKPATMSIIVPVVDAVLSRFTDIRSRLSDGQGSDEEVRSVSAFATAPHHVAYSTATT
jgi:hypothetical protein